MKTFRKSSLITSVALLLAAIVALSGATFAWFSTKADASATGIQATTAKGSALVISSTSEGPWGQSLDLAGENKLTAVTIENPNYKKVIDEEEGTTEDVVTWTILKGTAASYDAQKAASYEDAAASDYYKKTIYVKYDAAEDTTKALKADLILGEDAVYSSNKDYYRVALVPTGNTVAEDAPNYQIYSISDYNRATDATYGDYDVTTTATGIELGTLDAGTVYAYDVYVWFEGEDADCLDSNSVNDITVDIKFN